MNCRCIRCGDCGGSGRVMSRRDGYPESELESCVMCRGTGISEPCAACELKEEYE